jgi:hypothetical protein
MKKGIVDPWRVVAPLRPEKEEVLPTKPKINPGEVDLDAELRVTQYYILRSAYGSIRIDSKDIATENDALKLLIACFLHLVSTPKHRTLFKEAGIGFETLKRQWNVPAIPLAVVKTEESSLYFAKHSHERGMLALIGILNQINREDRGLLKKYGVSTLLR